MRLGNLKDGARFALPTSPDMIWTVVENFGPDVSVAPEGESTHEGRTWLPDMEVEPRIKATRIAGFVCITSHLPECDICIAEGEAIPNRARYDARTIHGPWANVCEHHFDTDTTGQLGYGYAQYLVPSEEMEAGGLLPERVVEAASRV